MSRTNAVRLMHDIEGMSPEELEDTYGITVDEDGNVWDSLEGREFDSLYAWAEFTAEQEEADDSFHKFGGKHWYDDD